MEKIKICSSYEKPKEMKIGTCKCEICGAIGDLILREGKQFRIWEVKCPNAHRPRIKKEIDDIFQIGDRIRLYRTPFGKENSIDLTTYEDGIVLNKERGIINYELDVKIYNSVIDNKPIVKSSWRYGHIIKGIDSDGYYIELLTPQMRLVI